jgi:hypothetical protein
LKEGQASGIAAGFGETEPGDLPEERVGQLGQDSGTVTGVRVRAGRAPVLEVAQHAQGAGHHIVAAPGGKVRDEAHTTGIMFETAVVKSVRCGRHHQNSCRQFSTVMRLLPWGRRWPCCYT